MPYGYNEKILHVNISDARREAVPFYCDTLATKALERSGILGGGKTTRTSGDILESTIGKFITTACINL